MAMNINDKERLIRLIEQRWGQRSLAQIWHYDVPSELKITLGLRQEEPFKEWILEHAIPKVVRGEESKFGLSKRETFLPKLLDVALCQNCPYVTIWHGAETTSTLRDFGFHFVDFGNCAKLFKHRNDDVLCRKLGKLRIVRTQTSCKSRWIFPQKEERYVQMGEQLLLLGLRQKMQQQQETLFSALQSLPQKPPTEQQRQQPQSTLPIPPQPLAQPLTKPQNQHHYAQCHRIPPLISSADEKSSPPYEQPPPHPVKDWTDEYIYHEQQLFEHVKENMEASSSDDEEKERLRNLLSWEYEQATKSTAPQMDHLSSSSIATTATTTTAQRPPLVAVVTPEHPAFMSSQKNQHAPLPLPFPTPPLQDEELWSACEPVKLGGDYEDENCFSSDTDMDVVDSLLLELDRTSSSMERQESHVSTDDFSMGSIHTFPVPTSTLEEDMEDEDSFAVEPLPDFATLEEPPRSRKGGRPRENIAASDRRERVDRDDWERTDGELLSFDRNGATMSQEDRTEMARKRGLCESCSRRTHEFSWLKRKPITNESVWKGFCRTCHPEKRPEPSPAAEAVAMIGREERTEQKKKNRKKMSRSPSLDDIGIDLTHTVPVASLEAICEDDDEVLTPQQEARKTPRRKMPSRTKSHDQTESMSVRVPTTGAARSSGRLDPPTDGKSALVAEARTSGQELLGENMMRTPKRRRASIVTSRRVGSRLETTESQYASLQTSDRDEVEGGAPFEKTLPSSMAASRRRVGRRLRTTSHRRKSDRRDNTQNDISSAAPNGVRRSSLQIGEIVRKLHRLRKLRGDHMVSRGLSAIVKTMTKYSQTKEIQIAAGGALWAMVVSRRSVPDASRAAAEKSAITALLDSVKLGEVGIMEMAFGALSSLSTRPGNKGAVVQAGGIDAIVSGLLKHPDSPTVFEWACRVLCGLVYHCDFPLETWEDTSDEIKSEILQNIVALQSSEVISIVLKSVSNGSNYVVAIECGIDLLRRLSLESEASLNGDDAAVAGRDKVLEQVLKEDGINVLTFVVKMRPTTARLQEKACELLSALLDRALLNGTLHELVSSSDWIRTTSNWIGAMIDFPDSEALKNMSCRLLAMLACTDDCGKRDWLNAVVDGMNNTSSVSPYLHGLETMHRISVSFGQEMIAAEVVTAVMEAHGNELEVQALGSGVIHDLAVAAKRDGRDFQPERPLKAVLNALIQGVDDVMVADLRSNACRAIFAVLLHLFEPEDCNTMQSVFDVLIKTTESDGSCRIDAQTFEAGLRALELVAERAISGTLHATLENVETVVSIMKRSASDEHSDYTTDGVEIATGILLGLARDSTNLITLAKCGGIRAIIDATIEMEGVSLPSKENGFSILGIALSSTNAEVRREVIPRAGELIDAIIFAMLRYRDNNYLQKIGCACLRHLSSYPESCDKTWRGGGVAAIGCAMRLLERDAQVQTDGCNALSNLALIASEDVLMEAQIVDLIWKTVRDHRDVTMLQERALGVLHALSMRSDNIKKEVAALDGIFDLVVRSMLEHLGSSQLVTTALGLLPDLISASGYQGTAQANECIAIINGMMANVDSGDAQKSACECLVALVSSGITEPCRIVELGGLDAVVLGMWGHFRSEVVLTEACRAFSCMMDHVPTDELESRLRSTTTEAARAMLISLRMHPHSATLHESACLALRKLSLLNHVVLTLREGDAQELLNRSAEQFPCRCSEVCHEMLSRLESEGSAVVSNLF